MESKEKLTMNFEVHDRFIILDLRKFTFRCTTEADKLKKSYLNLIFSKVTSLICFARCPYLTATFETALRNPCAEE